MSSKKTLKLTVLILFAVIFVVFAVFALNKQNDIAPLKLVSKEEISAFTDYVFKDYSEYIVNGDVHAAIDTETSTIYTSVSEDELDDASFLNGLLKLRRNENFLFYVLEENCTEAVANNKPLKIIIAEKDSKEYMQYNLVLSTLPIINLEGVDVGKDDMGRPLSGGEFALWNGRDEAENSFVQWRVRGASTTRYEKKSYKLALQRHREDNDMDLLGLGADDEWVLNAMVVDDTKVREKIMMHIWSEMQKTVPYSVKMSDGEYVELVVNGKYEGLYLLQRQISDKYLELGADSALLRGTDYVWIKVPQTPGEAYSIEFSNKMTADDLYNRMNGLFYENDFSSVDKDNWVDISLVTQFARLVDNLWLQNTYYIIDSKNDKKICILLWDTDQSFGLEWVEPNGVEYTSNTGFDRVRKEYEAMISLNPEVIGMTSKRYRQLREGILQYDHLYDTLTVYRSQLINSGALLRDQDENGLFHEGEDKFENILSFIEEQLRLMDEMYLEK